jgi:hypothetical protein
MTQKTPASIVWTLIFHLAQVCCCVDVHKRAIVNFILYLCIELVFTGGADGHIKYWRLKLDSEPQTLDFHEGIVLHSL